jgi:two-component system, OmpR family, alkaline phosphatase synthesis response regulator PhoP
MKKTILIVDDERDILDMLRYNLEKDGYGVLTALNGKSAMEQAHLKPDLILLDVMMPELDGWEVCKQLKRDQKTASIQKSMRSSGWRLVRMIISSNR